VDPISSSTAEAFATNPSSEAGALQSSPPTAPSSAHDTIEQYTHAGDAPASREPAKSFEANVLESARREARDRVELCKRDADLPGGHALHVKHHWIRTANKEAGMGADDGTIPGNRVDLPYLTKVTVNDHKGQGALPGSECTVVPDEDARCVDRELTAGRPLGRWAPTNQCQTFVADVLSKCSTQGK
jgi:hypothetical protein